MTNFDPAHGIKSTFDVGDGVADEKLRYGVG